MLYILGTMEQNAALLGMLESSSEMEQNWVVGFS